MVVKQDKAITLDEGDIGRSSTSISYGITSCLTVTYQLSDGSLLGAHFSLHPRDNHWGLNSTNVMAQLEEDLEEYNTPVVSRPIPKFETNLTGQEAEEEAKKVLRDRFEVVSGILVYVEAFWNIKYLTEKPITNENGVSNYSQKLKMSSEEVLGKEFAKIAGIPSACVAVDVVKEGAHFTVSPQKRGGKFPKTSAKLGPCIPEVIYH
ncbi:hypothetical protein ACL02S_01405 [Nocardia sp. 004]|uniref:hypothetical protein n=1 Tax=Nocardia sp. 004 TaxID=3385978 RepID=UPI0039A1627D